MRALALYLPRLTCRRGSAIKKSHRGATFLCSQRPSPGTVVCPLFFSDSDNAPRTLFSCAHTLAECSCPFEPGLVAQPCRSWPCPSVQVGTVAAQDRVAAAGLSDAADLADGAGPAGGAVPADVAGLAAHAV